jgi:hypothetical protein
VGRKLWNENTVEIQGDVLAVIKSNIGSQVGKASGSASYTLLNPQCFRRSDTSFQPLCLCRKSFTSYFNRYACLKPAGKSGNYTWDGVHKTGRF